MASRTGAYPRWEILLILMTLGGISGSWLGDILVKTWPGIGWLGHVTTVGLPAFTMDLHVFTLTFGFMFHISFFTILGFVMAWLFYKRL